MSFPRYERYKNSGVEWLGEVPEHWKVQPLYSLGFEREEPNTGMVEENLLSLSFGRIIRKDIETSEGLLPDSFETYQVVCPEDIIFRLTDLQNDKRSLRTAIVRERGIITFAYAAFAPTRISGDYLNYLLRDYDLRKIFYSMGGGVRQSMKFADIKRLPALLPPVEEQTYIEAFLDSETAKIDALLEEQRLLIELLKEKRQAVISHAVTKGLKARVSLRDSGIDWLGFVPVHWVSKPFKRVIDFQEGPGIGAADFKEHGVPLLRIAGVQNRWASLTGCNFIDEEWAGTRWRNFSLQEGDLLISASASMGTVCEVGAETVGAIAYTGIIRLRPDASLLQRNYLRYWATSSAFTTQIDLLKTGSMIQHYGPYHLNQMSIFLPPLSEQEAIVKHLAETTARTDELIEKVTVAIALLQERRTAIISAAVTGKIDVRNHSPKEAA